MITDIRLAGQQLAAPRFDTPKKLVSWMGAIQAQDYAMARWAVGIRLKSATARSVGEAFSRGEILRTHVMRPTWHLVAAEDIRWMLKLSARRIRSANESLAKGRQLELTEQLHYRCDRLLEKMLEGNRNLTKQQIGEELNRQGIAADTPRLTRLLMRAETEAVVCSGPFSGGKQTYALLEERVPPVPELHPDEALAKLATAYFRSHSPASMQDFVWWSGLSVTEARHSVGLIGRSLTAERFGQRELFVHESCRAAETSGVPLYLLPAYDEYLIGYKDRTDVLRPEHRARAFTNYGIFYPVILYGGRIAGNWKRPARPDDSCVETSFFETDTAVDQDILEEAVNRYRAFYRAV